MPHTESDGGPATGLIKVLLADDHSIVRAGLCRIVEESGDMTVVAEASDGKEAPRWGVHPED